MTRYIFGAAAPLLMVDETRSKSAGKLRVDYRIDTKENFMKTKTNVKGGLLGLSLGLGIVIGIGLVLGGGGCKSSCNSGC